MFQERYSSQGPNVPPPNGPFRRQQRPFFQRMPQENRPFLQQRPQTPHMGQPFRANGPNQQPSNSKGLLGKLFGKSQQAPQNLFAPPNRMNSEARNSGGLLDTLKNPEGLTTMLNNTQRVLQAAEQFTPMIQQYGPMVKNLPTLWKLMKAFNSSDTPTTSNNEETQTTQESSAKKQPESNESGNEKLTKRHVQKKNSKSVPKLYI